MNKTDPCVCIPPVLLRASDVHAHAFLQHSFSLTFPLLQLLFLLLSFHVPRGPELFSLTQTPYKFFEFSLLPRSWFRLLYFLLCLVQCFCLRGTWFSLLSFEPRGAMYSRSSLR